TGSLAATSNDAQAVLPASVGFLAADNGVKSGIAVTLKTAGSRTITFTDTTDPTLTVTSEAISVVPAAAHQHAISGLDSPPVSRHAGTLPVTVLDEFGNVATAYQGTIGFSSTDTLAGLPATYTFTPADSGTKTFQAVLKTVGTHSISAADTVTA